MPSSDFEVLQVGSIEEIRRSRALARAIDAAQREGHALPVAVLNAFAHLRQHYAVCIEQEQAS